MFTGSIRGGTRGGQGDFKWSDVAEDKDRENYLGHSILAPVGRWQKNRDITWYNKNGGPVDEDQRSRAKREEIQRIKAAEEDALSLALGFKPAPRELIGTAGPGSSSNAIPIAARTDQDGPEDSNPRDDRIATEKLRKAERAARKAARAQRREEKKLKQSERKGADRSHHHEHQHVLSSGPRDQYHHRPDRSHPPRPSPPDLDPDPRRRNHSSAAPHHPPPRDRRHPSISSSDESIDSADRTHRHHQRARPDHQHLDPHRHHHPSQSNSHSERPPRPRSPPAYRGAENRHRSRSPTREDRRDRRYRSRSPIRRDRHRDR